MGNYDSKPAEHRPQGFNLDNVGFPNGISDSGRDGLDNGFWALTGIYLIGMALLAARGHMLKAAASKAGGAEAYLSYHFLAGSSFGPTVIFLNYCAQYIGGIVMVKTPNDSRDYGFWMLMWISGCSWCGATFNIVQPRIREIMRGRHYVSPNDFFTDRYKSWPITFLSLLCGFCNMLMFTGLEWLALDGVLKAVVGLEQNGGMNEDDRQAIVWCLGFFILGCEIAGGMASVALTDAIQAGLLLVAFFVLPCLCEEMYGGFQGVGGYNCENLQIAENFEEWGIVGQATPFSRLHMPNPGSVNHFVLQLGTDACYQAKHEEDMANGCAVPVGDLFPGYKKGVYSLPMGLWGAFTYPFDYVNSPGGDYTFAAVTDENPEGVSSAYAAKVKPLHSVFGVQRGHQRVCKFALNSSYTSTQCPPEGTVYKSIRGNATKALGTVGGGLQPGEDLATGSYRMKQNHDRLAMTDNGDGTFTYNIETVNVADNCTDGTTVYTSFDDVPETVTADNGDGTYTVLSAGICNDTWIDNRTYLGGAYDYLGQVTLPDGSTGFTKNAMRITQMGCSGINQWGSWHWKYPQREIFCYMFSFGFMWIAFALSPITLHRTMTAKSADALRSALTILHLFPISFFIPVILLGQVASGLFPQDGLTVAGGGSGRSGEGVDPDWEGISTFPLIAFKLAEASAFGAIVAVISLVACCASFMSTADSIIICCSVMGTVDGWHHLIRRNQSAIWELNVVKIVISTTMIVCGISLALYADVDFVELLNIGNGILGSVIPVYLGMFFHEFRALEVFLAMLVNIAVVLSFECARMWPPAWVGDCAQCAAEGNPKSKFFGKQYDMQSRNSPGFLQPIGAGDTRETYLHLLPPFWGLIFCIPAVFIFHFMFRNCEGAHQAFDRLCGLPAQVLTSYGKERMDLDREGKIVAELMEGVHEPLKHYWCWPFLAFPYLTWLFMPFHRDVGEDTKDVVGMPDWGTMFTIVNSFGTFCLCFTTAVCWKGRPGEGEGASNFGVEGSQGIKFEGKDEAPVSAGGLEKELGDV